MSDRVRIGDLLVAAKLVTAAQVEEALASQRDSGRRLGEELVAKGFVTEFQLTQILSRRRRPRRWSRRQLPVGHHCCA